MPIYTYRRADGTTFDIRQKFSDNPLTVDPNTGQSVHRIPQASGVIFKGSGFYVTDTKGAARTTSTSATAPSDGKAESATPATAATAAPSSTPTSEAAAS